MQHKKNKQSIVVWGPCFFILSTTVAQTENVCVYYKNKKTALTLIGNAGLVLLHRLAILVHSRFPFSIPCLYSSISPPVLDRVPGLNAHTHTRLAFTDISIIQCKIAYICYRIVRAPAFAMKNSNVHKAMYSNT